MLLPHQVGLLLYEKILFSLESLQKPVGFWHYGFWVFLFILVFNLMAATLPKKWVSVASVATKMSLVIPSLSLVCWYILMKNLGHKILRISWPLPPSISLLKEKGYFDKEKASLVLPAPVFIGSGVHRHEH